MKTNWFSRLIQCLFGKIAPSLPSDSNPTYVNYHDNIVLEPPGTINGCQMYCFFFTSNGGDKSKLQQLIDRRLNFPANASYKYEVFAADIMMTFASSKADRSTPDRMLGVVEEKEVVCWVPLLEKVKINGRWVSNRLVWFIPYIVVNNSWAMAAGREIFGLPKSLGSFQIPENPDQAHTFTSTTFAFKTYGPTAVLQEYPFLSIAKDDTSTTNKATEFTPFADGKHALNIVKEVFLAAEGILEDFSFRLCIHEIEDLIHLQQPWVMLKQFREITDSTSACYQALVEGPLPIQKFHGGGLMLDTYRLGINQLASMPVGEDLGLTDGQLARAALWVNVDFTVALGKVLWKG